jgi:hypothetical protein
VLAIAERGDLLGLTVKLVVQPVDLDQQYASRVEREAVGLLRLDRSDHLLVH